MRILVATVVVSFLGFLGCTTPVESPAPAPPPPPDWTGDERFTTGERADIEAGAVWLYAQAGLPAPRIAWDLVAEGKAATPRSIRRERGAYGEHGATGLCANGTIYLDVDGNVATNETAVGRHLPGLTAHELAHCVLGFVDGYHAGDVPSDGIMRNLTPMVWSEAEREQCRRSPACHSSASPSPR